MNSLFCRHNRFTADCPICSKGTVLEGGGGTRGGDSRRAAGRARDGRESPARPTPAAPRFTGPYAAGGPYADDDGQRYEVRLERVPGGLRLAEWSAGALRRRAPRLPSTDLARLVEGARARNLAPAPELDALAAAVELAGAERPAAELVHGASAGRSGEMRDELRVEPLGDGIVRVGRWTLRPGTGWQLHEAPTMYPVARYAEALLAAARNGAL